MARNRNLRAAITHAKQVYSQHSFGIGNIIALLRTIQSSWGKQTVAPISISLTAKS